MIESVDHFLARLKQRDPAQPEFHQAVERLIVERVGLVGQRLCQRLAVDVEALREVAAQFASALLPNGSGGIEALDGRCDSGGIARQ